MIDPNSRWVLEAATLINDRGQIVASGLLNGVQENALLTARDHVDQAETGTSRPRILLWKSALPGYAVKPILKSDTERREAIVFKQHGRRPRAGIAWAVLLALAAYLGGTAEQSAATYTPLDLYTLTAPSPGALASDYPQCCVGGQVVGVAPGVPGLSGYATMWTNSGTPVNLHPTTLGNFIESAVNGTSGAQQVGYGQLNGDYRQRALLWNGSAASAVDLTPTNLPGFTDSVAIGTSGTQQVGYASDPTSPAGNAQYAFLWNGTGSSAVNLTPNGFRGSSAWGTNGHQQVGGGVRTLGNAFEALLWSGTADSLVDLDPTRLAGFDGSFANGISSDGRQQVGNGSFNTPGEQANHALLWSGTADSAVDLHPAQLGLDNSIANATNGSQQVGYGYRLADINHRHALVWSGTVASAVDLQALFPPSIVSSDAYSIDANGNVFGIAIDTSGKSHAVEWVVPEPSTNALLPLAASATLVIRLRRGVLKGAPDKGRRIRGHPSIRSFRADEG